MKAQVAITVSPESGMLLKTIRALARPRGFESHALRSGLPTELPVSYRQNCAGDRFCLCLRCLTLALAAARVC